MQSHLLRPEHQSGARSGVPPSPDRTPEGRNQAPRRNSGGIAEEAGPAHDFGPRATHRACGVASAAGGRADGRTHFLNEASFKRELVEKETFWEASG